jgi:hypothetical protein
VSLHPQTEGLYIFFEHQKWRSNAEYKGRERVIVCFKCFWKNSSESLSSFSPISSTYLVHFEWFKTWGVISRFLLNTIKTRCIIHIGLAIDLISTIDIYDKLFIDRGFFLIKKIHFNVYHVVVKENKIHHLFFILFFYVTLIMMNSKGISY